MQFEIILGIQIMGSVLMLVLLSKMIQMKRQIEHVIKEVEGYIAFITEETEDKTDTNMADDVQYKKEEPVYQANLVSKLTKESKDTEQTQLIQAVLGEYFP